jgi:hypothetical protein
MQPEAGSGSEPTVKKISLEERRMHDERRLLYHLDALKGG